MSKEQVNLSEHRSSRILPEGLFTEEEIRYLHENSTYWDVKRREVKPRYYIHERREGIQFQSLSWVGVIELSKVRICITTKFDKVFTRLVEMLSFLHEIPFNKRRETSGEYGESDFVELLAQVFLEEVEKILRVGVVKEYVNVEENLNQLRGRPDFIVNQRLNFATPTRMYCHFDELLTDIPENKVLRSALEKLGRLSLLPDTLKSTRLLRGEFEEICESFSDQEWPFFQYNRLNDHYRTVHELAFYIIHRISLKDIFGEADFSHFSLLMDMNELFEKFAGKMLTVYLPNDKYQVDVGETYNDSIRKNGSLYRSIEPDIVVFNREENKHIVLDVKYKNYGGKKKIKNEDIYQLSFYAHSFHRDKAKECHVQLIYPRYANEHSSNEVISLLDGTPHHVILHTKSLDIEYCLELIKAEDLTQLNELVLNLISE